jgi:hypothetical protein
VGALNYTTNIPTNRTVGEVQALLVEAGAGAVMVRYELRVPVGLSFALATAHGDRQFDLPVHIEGMQQVLIKQVRTGKISGGKSRVMYESREHAARVAWRTLKDWVEAQLALIQAQMATLDQVMLPYLRVDGQTTLYEAYRRNEQRALTAGQS